MYTTGTTTGCADFLQKLAMAAAAAGWTVDQNAAVTSDGWWLALHNGTGCYVNLHAKAADNQIDLWGATGYNGSNTYSNQPGVPSYSNLIAYTGGGPFVGYHIFTKTGTSPYLHCVIEVSAGVFVHLHMGTLVSPNGGGNVQYHGCSSITSVSGAYYNSFPAYQTAPWSNGSSDGMYINATIDSVNRWFKNEWTASSPTKAIFPAVNQSLGAPYGHMIYWTAAQAQPNTFNGLPVLLPMPLFLERAAGGIFAYVGDAPDVRQFNMRSNNPKDEITIGSDVWKVFPIGVKGSNVNVPSAPYCSGNGGFAFKKSA